jgi:hypothetical protein
MGYEIIFARLISHQPAVLFSQNKPATSQQYSSLRTNQHQPSVLFSQNKLAPAISNQPPAISSTLQFVRM